MWSSGKRAYSFGMREDASHSVLDQDHHLAEVAGLMAEVIRAQQDERLAPEQSRLLDQWLDELDRTDD